MMTSHFLVFLWLSVWGSFLSCQLDARYAAFPRECIVALLNLPFLLNSLIQTDCDGNPLHQTFPSLSNMSANSRRACHGAIYTALVKRQLVKMIICDEATSYSHAADMRSYLVASIVADFFHWHLRNGEGWFIFPQVLSGQVSRWYVPLCRTSVLWGTNWTYFAERFY